MITSQKVCVFGIEVSLHYPVFSIHGWWICYMEPLNKQDNSTLLFLHPHFGLKKWAPAPRNKLQYPTPNNDSGVLSRLGGLGASEARTLGDWTVPINAQPKEISHQQSKCQVNFWSLWAMRHKGEGCLTSFQGTCFYWLPNIYFSKSELSCSLRNSHKSF